MTRPLRIVYPGAFYHITSRGNEKRAIFSDRRDRERFIGYLESATQRYDATIHAFCLMTNHYHLLLETPSGNLPQIMRHINGAYTTYFNVKQERAGHLFQGRYKAILVDADGYAKNLSRYIHLNPVRGNLVEKPEEYPWSSYRCYIDKQLSPQWLRRNFILAYFGNSESDAQKRYRTFVEFLLNKKYENPLKDTIGATLLGRPEFIDFIRKNHISNDTPDRDLPSLKKLVPQASLATIFKEVELCFCKDPG